VLDVRRAIAAATVALIGQLDGIEREVKPLNARRRQHERRTRAAQLHHDGLHHRQVR